MIRWAEDLGAPALVAAADIATDELRPTWNRPLGIGLAAVGYILSGLVGIGGTFTKNIGIAAAPWAFGSIYQYIKEGAGVGGRVVARPVSTSRIRPIGRYPAQETKEEFEGTRLIG